MLARATLTAMCLLLSANTWAGCQQVPGVTLFFDRLAGDWQGEAVVTPVGPRPYDIRFERLEPFWIYGQANPGAAIHPWGFYCEDDELRLRFLSTFRGNRDPLLLEAVRITDAEVQFKAQAPAFLEVAVRPGNSRSVIEVLHHGERHVLIELEH